MADDENFPNELEHRKQEDQLERRPVDEQKPCRETPP